MLIFSIPFLILIISFMFLRDYGLKAMIIFLVIIILMIISFFSYQFIKKRRKYKAYGGKYNAIIKAIENYSTDRIIRDEREFETILYEYLKYKFPELELKFQYKISKGRIDIVVDNEIALELKIADNSGNLNSLFGQIEWYKDEFEKLGIVILDIGNIPNINDFVRRFEQKGAKVVVLKKKQVRVKR